jgi:GDP-4-dehydro-6-deoxy-D-mannose reductase
MRILITGATGFVGGHLAEALLAQGGAELHGLCRRAAWPAEWSHLTGSITLHQADLTDGPAVEAIVRAVRPVQVYHLAGYAHTGRSFSEPAEAWAGNLTATLSLYDALARWGGEPRVLAVSSGLVYGDPDPPVPRCDERLPLRPASPYAASKAAADLAGYQYTRHPGLAVVRVRPFNHTGPRQSPQYAVPNFARQIAAIERGRQPPVLETGDLRPRRDLTDVRDMVTAYRLLMERGRVGEVYNAGRGEAHSMQEVLDRLLAGSQARVEVRSKAQELRPVDTAVACADSTKLRHETGWGPAYSLDQTLTDILDYWRSVTA